MTEIGVMDPRFKMLCSYWYFSKKDMADILTKVSGPKPLVFADSGAHTARTMGVHLSVDEYADWCFKWAGQLSVLANLDVIGAPAATWRNQKALEARGLSVVPVFHTGEDWSWLERYISEGYTYIALGKLLGNSYKVLKPWLAKAFRVAGDRCVFHGFGMNVWEGLRDFPFYSVDSSSWGQGFRFGQLKMFDQGRWVTATIGDRTSLLRCRELIREHGQDPTPFLDRSTYERQFAVKMAAVAHKRAETWLRARHGAIRIPGLSDPGLHQYVVDSKDPQHYVFGSAGLHSYVADTVTRQFRLASNAITQKVLEEA